MGKRPRKKTAIHEENTEEDEQQKQDNLGQSSSSSNDESLYEGHPKTKTLRTSYYDDEGHTYAEGSQEPNVDRPRANPSDIGGPSATSSQARSRPRTGSKTSVNLKELAEAMIAALKSLVSQQQTSNIYACVDRLNTLGIEHRDPLYRAAFDIFGHSTLLREVWLKMPSNPELLKEWISRTARRLGFME